MLRHNLVFMANRPLAVNMTMDGGCIQEAVLLNEIFCSAIHITAMCDSGRELHRTTQGAPP